MKKFINLGIDIGAVLVIVGIIAFFLIGGPKGNPEVTTTEIISTTSAIETTTELVEETTTKVIETTEDVEKTTTKVIETTTESVKETTTKVVETTKKEAVTVKSTSVPKVRAKSGSKYTDKEIYLFAQILYCEAGGESKAEMARVGKVVLNRINTNYWEFKEVNTFYDVVTQSGQYPETLKKIKGGIVPSKEALEVATGLVNGTIDSGLSDEVYWQTGFIPDWNAKVVCKFPMKNGTGYHYYSVLA